MISRRVLRIATALFVVSLTIAAGYAYHKRDPFFAYRALSKKPLQIKAQPLTHYGDEEKLIREKLKLDISHREKVILSGLHWLITYMDKDDHFDFVFCDFVMLMHKLSNSDTRIHQGEIAKSIIKTTLSRGEKNLDSIFAKDERGRFQLIYVFDVLTHYPEFQASYYRFYKENFPSIDLNKIDGKNFSIDIKTANYQNLFMTLVQYSFLNYFLEKEKTTDLVLPPNNFEKYLKEFEQFEYIKDHPPQSPQFRQLGYLATHVILVLTNYGERPIVLNDVNTKKAQDYIEHSLEMVQNDLSDFDLFAEYVQSLKILNPGRDSRVKDLEQIIFDLQRPDGSWGSARDFKTNPYTAIHPGGAALMALNQRDY